MTTIPRKSRSNFHSPSFKSPDRCDNTAIGTFWDFVENCPPPTKGARTARASAHSSSAPRACSVPSALVSGNALPARRHTRRCRARFREQTVPRARPLPAAYSVLVQYADKPPTVEWNGVGHFRQQAAGYAARRGEFVDIRAALQLGSGLMVSQMANYLRGTAVPEYKCGFQVSLFVHFVCAVWLLPG